MGQSARSKGLMNLAVLRLTAELVGEQLLNTPQAVTNIALNQRFGRRHAATCWRLGRVRSVEARYAAASGVSAFPARFAASMIADRRQGGISAGIRLRHSLTVCCGKPVASASALTPPKASKIEWTTLMPTALPIIG